MIERSVFSSSTVSDAHLISLKESVGRIVGIQTSQTRRAVLHVASPGLDALLLAHLLKAPSFLKHLVVVVLPSDLDAQRFHADLCFFLNKDGDSDQLPSSALLYLPEEEVFPWDDGMTVSQTSMQRLRVCFQLLDLKAGVLVASAQALQRRLMPKAAMQALSVCLKKEQELSRETLLQIFLRNGYVRRPVCEDVGTFSVHGGVLDVFGLGHPYPVRLEFFGDWIESIRLYDPQTQRTLRALDDIWIHPVSETIPTPGNEMRIRLLEAGELSRQSSSHTRELLEKIENDEFSWGNQCYFPAYHAYSASIEEYLPADRIWFVVDPPNVDQALVANWNRAMEAHAHWMEERRLSFPAESFFLSLEDWHGLQSKKDCFQMVIQRLHLETTPEPDAAVLRLAVEGQEHVAQALKQAQANRKEQLLLPLVKQFESHFINGTAVAVVLHGLAHAERMEALLKSYEVPTFLHRPGLAHLAAEQASGFLLHDQSPLLRLSSKDRVNLYLGSLSRGFYLPMDGLAVYAEDDIFGEKKASRFSEKKPKKQQRLDDFKDLPIGGYVIHKLHGMGRYVGLTKLPLAGVEIDFVHLQYEGGLLYLPVWRLNELQRYTGAEGSTPKLDKLGGETWQKTRSKISKEVEKLADELLKIYAQRQALPGVSHRLDEFASRLFAEFESTFPYEETPDQKRAIDDVLDDLDQARPMDRLVCGDVGYGKTEVALRAAMKVALSGKQVAFLAPTTVLVEQHAVRFSERFSGSPVRVASLSRFRSKAEQLETIKGLADGSIDVVVGTHRLLSADVRFKRLGLLMVDEEQRFGVSHKEQLKKFRSQIDTLTLTATPIPRTLHMAFGGLREISMITTPPQDRLSVRTLIARESEQLICEGIQNELHRGGQVFFVHNRIETLGKWAQRLQTWLPHIRLLVAHGQMPEDQLERVMLGFIRGEADVLLCTTIIESGLDIPRANTMFVDRADTFGLSQLYQLRGRVGRSKERAYCYLLIPPENIMGSEAKQRLMVLQRFSDLGSGLNIASQDLEIRGAGELLGSKQSGSIAAVGFDMYSQMLQEAVAHLKGQPLVPLDQDTDLTCDIPAFIPESYIADVGQRLDFYKRFASALDEEEINKFVEELQDRYGHLPDEVVLLADLMTVKTMARRLRVLSIEITTTRLALAFAENTPLSAETMLSLINTPKSAWKRTPDNRLARHFVGEEEKKKRLALSKAWILELLEHRKP